MMVALEQIIVMAVASMVFAMLRLSPTMASQQHAKGMNAALKIVAVTALCLGLFLSVRGLMELPQADFYPQCLLAGTGIITFLIWRSLALSITTGFAAYGLARAWL
jgi:hypothetical protein